MSKQNEKSLANLNRSGRAVGSKNKSTLVREALRGEFEDLLAVEGKKVFMAVVERAIEGSDAAAKMILDRIVPVDEGKQAGKLKFGEGGLTIVIEKLEAQPNIRAPLDGEMVDAVYEEVKGGSCGDKE